MPEIPNTMGTACKCLSRKPQLMVRKYAANPKHQGEAMLIRLLATRDALGKEPNKLETHNGDQRFSTKGEVPVQQRPRSLAT